MDETSDGFRHGLSPEARRNYVDTASLTPRDKENAGANSTRNSRPETEQSKASSAPTPQAPASNRTPARARLTSQDQDQKVSSTFFAAASPPSPSPTGSATAVNDSDSNHNKRTQHPKHQSPAGTTPSCTFDWSAQKSPPGTSQVLRKHFQSLGFATPGKHTQQHRLLSSGAVRLATPSSRKKANKGIDTTMARLGYDGTKHTPSKELLKSTASSRSHRIANLHDMSMDQEAFDYQPEFQIQQPQNQFHSSLEPMHDDELSTEAGNGTLDDASFDISLPGMNHSYAGNSLLEPQSPMTPRMGCSDPVALTLLNDGKEDYHFLMAQDALFPVPKIEDRDETASGYPESSLSPPSSSSPASCLSPASRQSPAEVRGTLSQNARSTLARPVAVMAKGGRVSPTAHHPPRLMMRPQPKHIR